MLIGFRVKSSLPKIINMQLSQQRRSVATYTRCIYSNVHDLLIRARGSLVHTWQSGQVLFIGISIPAIISIRDQCRDSLLSQVVEFHETYIHAYEVIALERKVETCQLRRLSPLYKKLQK